MVDQLEYEQILKENEKLRQQLDEAEKHNDIWKPAWRLNEFQSAFKPNELHEYITPYGETLGSITVGDNDAPCTGYVNHMVVHRGTIEECKNAVEQHYANKAMKGVEKLEEAPGLKWIMGGRKVRVIPTTPNVLIGYKSGEMACLPTSFVDYGPADPMARMFEKLSEKIK